VDSLVVVRIGSLELQNDLSPSGWVIDQIHDFATDVGSVIPDGFEAYARLFHPAIRIVDGEEVTVRWSEIAAANGRTVHPEMQWPHISGVWEHSGENSPGLWDLEPDVGTMPRRYTDRLRDLLAQYTSTSDRVWFCVWDGFGDLKILPGGSALLTSGPPGGKRRRAQQPPPAPTLHLPNRAYYLLSGPIGGIGESMCEEPHWQSTNLLWPEDRAWCVATEIDFAWTYIGGGTALIQALINDPALEAMPTQIHHGITYEADRINPPPARP
jgi:hypothetical protein